MVVEERQPVEEDEKTWRFLFKNKLAPFIFKHFLMLGILFILLIGMTVPQPGEYVGRFKGSTYICVIFIFLHSGLKLKTAEVKDAIKNYKAFLWGFLSIMLFSSIIGSKLTQLLPFGSVSISSKNNNITSSQTSIVGPGEFQIGLELYFISPCAISSGVVLVTLAGGDITFAILLTVTTNTLAVFIVPLMAKWLLTVKNVEVDMGNLLVKLVSTVLLPLLVGKALTYINFVKEKVKKYTKTLKICSIIFLICIPWMKISKAKISGSVNLVSPLSILIMLFWVLATHILFVLMNYIAAWVLRFSLELRKTLVILPSIKTLAITLSIISFLPDEFGDGGLMSLPLIISHLCLLLLDSIWVVYWSNRTKNTKHLVVVESSGSLENQENFSKNIYHVTTI